MKNPAYAALLTISERWGLPKRFRTDLTKHDRAALEARPSDPFVWCLREDGTHLIWADSVVCKADGRRRENVASAYPAMVEKAFAPHVCQWFFWDGAYLIGLRSAEEARERLEYLGRGTECD